MREILSKSVSETELFGIELADSLQPGDVVGFYGGLGSGKTTIIKAIARGLGVTDIVNSPTFTLMHIYSGRAPVLHLDCYRLHSPEEAGNARPRRTILTVSMFRLLNGRKKLSRCLPDSAVRVSMERYPGQEQWRTITVNER